MVGSEITKERTKAASHKVKERDYWLNQLSGQWQKTAFYYGHPETKSSKSLERHAIEFSFTGEVFSDLKRLSGGSDQRLFMILAAQLLVLLYKYTANKDIIVGAPIYRQEAEGDFVNTVLTLRNKVEPGITFKQLLLQVRRVLVQAVEHQNYPIEALVKKLEHPVSPEPGDEFPLFDITILLENVHEKSYIQHIPTNMSFSFRRTEQAVEGAVEYNPARYSAAAVETIARHYQYLVRWMMASLDTRLADLQILSGEEKNRLLIDFNDTAGEYPAGKTIHRLFREQVEQTPDYPALHGCGDPGGQGRAQITYGELNRKSNRLARRLLERGVKPDTFTAIMVERSIEMIIAILGILKAGGAYLPIDPYYPEERKKYMLTDSGVGLLLTNLDKKALDYIPGKVEILDIDNPGTYCSDGKTPGEIAKDSNLLYLVYTSGSTGKPKGVMLEHGNAVNLIHFDLHHTNLDFRKVLQFHTIGFDASFHEIFCALLSGGELVLVDQDTRLDIPALFKVVEKKRVPTLFLPMSFLRIIFNEENYTRMFPRCVKHIQTAGEQVVINRRSGRFLQRNHVYFHNHYGPAETHVVTTLTLDPTKHIPELPAIGKPILNTQIYILDKERQLLPPGVPGELYIGGKQVGRGYLNNPELTAEKFILATKTQRHKDVCFSWCLGASVAKLYRTGDLACWLSDGNIEFLGRVDTQLKLRGFRVEPGEIESRLMDIDYIKEAVVIDRRDKSGEMFLCAYVVSTGEINTAELRDLLAKTLPDYMVPAYFVQLEKIPLSPNGKVKREALPPIDAAGVKRAYAAPRDEREKTLCRFWSEVLGVEKDTIGIDDNFFQLGGHSLKATILITKIYKAFKVRLILGELFNHPTIKGMTRLIKDAAPGTFNAIEPLEKKEYYPMSSAQKRMYIVNQMEPGNIGYNMPEAMTLDGSTDKDKFERAIKQLIERHESLRTSFHLISVEYVQKIHDDVQFEMETFDPKSQELRAKSYIYSFIRPFDLSRAPLLRVGLVKQDGQKHILIVDMHHIITDGISNGIFIKDFISLYQGENMPALHIRYKDFSGWQDKEKKSLKEYEAYWLKEFSDEIPLLNLPLDFTRPPVKSFEGASFDFTLAAGETRGLKKLAAETGATLFMVMLAMYNIFLSKISSQEDIIIGTPVSGRRQAHLEEIIGMFVNTLPLRYFPIGKITFNQFLKQVKQRTLKALENQDYPFEDLVEQLGLNREISRNPLFDTMFDLLNFDMPRVEIPGLKLIPYQFENIISKFDLTLHISGSGEKLHLTFVYSSKLFKAATIERFAGYFKRIAARVLEKPGTEIVNLELIEPGEKQQILFEFNRTYQDFPRDKTIHELFEEQVKRTPDHMALIGQIPNSKSQIPEKREPSGQSVNAFGQMHLSYGELHEKSNRWARQLSASGVQADNIAAIMMERSIEMIVAILGILKAGGAYLPLDPDYPEERIEFMLKDSGAGVLITGSGIQPGVKLPTSLSASSTLTSTSTCRVSPANLAYVMYTSGTTGKPKGILVEHQNVVNVVWWFGKKYYLGPGTHVLQMSDYTFDPSVEDIFGTLLQGAVLYLMSKEMLINLELLREYIENHTIHLVNFVPHLLNELLNHGSKLESIRVVVSGGERLDDAVKDNILEKGYELYNHYGPTETTIDALTEKCSNHRVTLGTPISNMRCYIVDKYSNLTPPGVCGELWLAGAGVSRGYLNDPGRTAEKFIKKEIKVEVEEDIYHRSYRSNKSYILYKTGDLARRQPGGNIEYLGRIDHQVKIRGNRIELGEIENRLRRHENIKETVVVAKQEKADAMYLCAYIVPLLTGNDETGDLSVSKLREFLSGELPQYMIPRYFVQLDKIPLTSSGKIDRRLLPEPDISNIKQDSVYVEPADETEQLIAGVWKDILKLDRVGTHDNFFHIGGNSLKVLQVNKRLTEVLGIKISVVNLFQYPTISGLKDYMQGRDPVRTPQPGRQETGAHKESTAAGIAVIGMAGRFPGASDINRCWENLKNGVESISFFSSAELAEQGVSMEMLENPDYVKAKGIIGDKDRFDAAFFNYTPQEARVMDPQMRVFHESVWEAFEDAGYNPGTYDNPVGIYAGAAYNSVWEAKVRLFIDADTMSILEAEPLVNSHFIPTRISYKMNLKGPAVFVQSACSTSLTAIHTAINALWAGDCAMALAGGVSLAHEKKSGYLYQEGMILSPDGSCRAFDAGAGGTVGGEGAAVVLLKPLTRATADGDHIYAVVKASASNNDGTRKGGFSAPSIDGQTETIAAAYGKAGIPPESVTYIETHGTGTILGDPIELAALKQAFKTTKKGYCAIGSVKTNVGHMDSAAGAVGFIKAVFALKHKRIPPSLHFETPNLHADLIDSPFYINTRLSEWNPGPYPLRAGVSSFGIGGTNVHMVLEEYANAPAGRELFDGPPGNFYKIVMLSARSSRALEKAKQNLLHFLKMKNGLNLEDITYTLQIGRKSFSRRWLTVCTTLEEAIAALDSPGAGETRTCLPDRENSPPLAVEFSSNKQELTQTGQLWLQGQEIDWKKFYANEKRNRVPLPTYPFEVDGQRFWIEGDPFDMKDFKETTGDIQPVRKGNIADWFYLPRWSRPARVPSKRKKQEALCFLILSNESPLVLKLEERLRSANTPGIEKPVVVTVKPGKSFEKKGDGEFVIEIHRSADYEALFTVLNRKGIFPRRILHTWNVSEHDDEPEPGRIGEGFYSLLHLVRAIGKQGFAGEIRIDVLTAGVQEVTGNEPLVPEKAAVLGPLKVIPQEYPFIVCRSIDIELPPAGSPVEEKLADCLRDELFVDFDTPDTDIAYRGYHRWVKTYEPIRVESPGAVPVQLRERGVYLVTGGYGNIGFTLAGYLAEKVRARLILTGPTPLIAREQWDHWLQTHEPEDKVSRKILEIRQLEAVGGDVSVRSPLKVVIIPTFRGIVVQVRIFRLKRAKKAFSAEIFPWKWHFCHFQSIQNDKRPPRDNPLLQLCSFYFRFNACFK